MKNMTEKDIRALKDRQARAVEKAGKELAGTGCVVSYYTTGHGATFSLSAIRPTEVRFIRVVLADDGDINRDITACRKVKVPPNCTREVWSITPWGQSFMITNV